MKRKVTMVVMAVAIATVGLLTSCQSTGDLGKDAQTFWNSKAVQDQLAALQKRAFEILSGFLGGLGTSAMSRASGASTADRIYSQLKVENPNVPDAVLRGVADKAAKGE